MKSITNFDDFKDKLITAKEKVSALSTAFSDDNMLKSIYMQLCFLDEWVKHGASPLEEKLEKMNFGLLASKVVDQEDSELASQIYLLANYVDDIVESREQRQS